MSRQMEIDGELFRAVITFKKMVQNPTYQWDMGFRDRDLSIPSSIPSETETVTKVIGPYRRIGDAKSQMKQAMRNGYGVVKHVVGHHIEKAIVTWEEVD
jgi:hypothetical protein